MKKSLAFFVLVCVLLPSGWQASPSLAEHAARPGVELARLEGQLPLAASSEPDATRWLYPEDIDPPETCYVPGKVPLGQDVEMMLGPWSGPNALLGLAQPSTWNDEADLLGGVTASTDLAVVALSTEELVAAWADEDKRVNYATWGAGGGWISGATLEAASSKPALLSRGPTHWAIFARFNTKIRVREWYMGSLGIEWHELPGIDDAASDPVVLSKDAGHMAVFYRTATGVVKFTEWEGTWLSEPVSLGQPTEARTPLPIVSELSAVSRTDKHLAVFGVDAAGNLWFRQRSYLNELDWSDTAWVKLLEGAEVAKPAVASRHANHIGVVVMDTSGQPYYTRWAWVPRKRLYLPLVLRASDDSQLTASETESPLVSTVAGSSPAGWSQPIPLGDATFVSPLTLAPRGVDSLVVLGVQADGSLYEMVWTEDSGWGSWQAIAGADMMAGQVVANVMRRVEDVMLLGRYVNEGVWYKHYTSLDKPLTDSTLSSPLEGLPRAQTLVPVEGRWVWVSVTRRLPSGTWAVEARELSTGYSANLDLAHADSGQASNRVAVASADLDVDGNGEVVVATLRGNQSDIDLSVLELSFPTPATLAISASPRDLWPDPVSGEDLNVAIGDLDGDQAQDEVVVGYRSGSTSMRFGIFHYTGYGLSQQGGPTELHYRNWCEGVGDCSVGDHDLEMAIARVAQSPTAPGLEHLVVLDTSSVTKSGVEYAQDWIVPSQWMTATGSLEPIGPGCWFDSPPTSSLAGTAYGSALGAGDVDVDGLENIVYSFADRLVVLTDLQTCDYEELSGLPDTERSLAMGDMDTDGRSEAAVAYRDGNTTNMLFEMVEGGALRQSAQRPVSGGHTVLAADVDNDTRLAELAGCKTFTEIRVVAVVNGPPRWYAAGQPIQSSGGVYGRTETSGGGTTDGTTHRYGGSLSMGYEYEFNVPVTAVKIGEVRGQVTVEFMGSSGTIRTEVSATTHEMGYQYEAISRGMVVYNSTEFTCNYYDVYPPDAPDNKNRAMLCTPTGRVCAEDFKPLEDWHASSFKQEAGPSWVDAGHRAPSGLHTNDLEEAGNYERTLPVDASRVKYTWPASDPVKVSYSSLGGFTNYWHVSDMTGGESEDVKSFEVNTELSLGMTAGGFTLDVAGKYGYLHEWSDVTSWEESLEMGAAVEKFQDPARLCYDLVPFVYAARAQTAAGVTYPYLEMDYYVPRDPYPCAREAE